MTGSEFETAAEEIKEARVVKKNRKAIEHPRSITF
jgi:hypothetical protein